MKLRGKRLALSFVYVLIIVVLATGCNKESKDDSDQKSTSKVYDTYLLFEGEDVVDGDNIATMYVNDGEDIKKVDNGVLMYSVSYDNQDDSIYYIKSNKGLYHYANDEKESVKISDSAESIFDVGLDKDSIIYQDPDDSVYVYHGGENIKLGTNNYNVELLGDEVYYIDNDELLKFNLESKEEFRIADGVYDFKLLSDKDEILYNNESGSLFYMSSIDSDSIRISNNYVDLNDVVKKDDDLYFIENESEEEFNLYLADLEENTRAELLIEDIVKYKFVKDKIYYMSLSGNLYLQSSLDSPAKRLATDVSNFRIKEGDLIYMDSENNLYSWDEKDKEKLVSKNVIMYNPISDGRIFYLNDDKELYLNNKRVATDVDTYSILAESMMYADEDKLYHMVGGGDAKLVSEDVSKYSAVMYQNNIIYENILRLDDIAGVWKFDDDDSQVYFQIDADGNFKNLSSGDEREVTLEASDYDSIILSVDGESLEFKRKDDKLVMVTEDKEYNLNPSDKKQASDYQDDLDKQVAMEESKAEARAVVEGFIGNLASAVNYGEYNYISDYINPSSNLYKSQDEFVLNLYDKDIEESLVEYKILDVSAKGNDIIVKTKEVFDIYNPEKDTKRSSYNASYLLKKVDESYLITSIDVE